MTKVEILENCSGRYLNATTIKDMILVKIISSSLAIYSSDLFSSAGASLVGKPPAARQCSTMLFSTLNEDGDFIIGGLNDNDSNSSNSGDESSSTLPNVAETQKQLASLLKIDYAVSTNSGDISDIDEQQDLKSFDFIKESVKIDDDMSSRSREGNRKIDELQLTKIQGFLTSILTLTESDLKYYAVEFVSIGFDPDCNSSGELEYDDLGFMKQLHRRYFWKEWEKLL